MAGDEGDAEVAAVAALRAAIANGDAMAAEAAGISLAALRRLLQADMAVRRQQHEQARAGAGAGGCAARYFTALCSAGLVTTRHKQLMTRFQ